MGKYLNDVRRAIRHSWNDNFDEVLLHRVLAIFDADYYLRSYPDVATAGDPLVHYLLHGWAEGRNPSPLFDANFYLQSNADVLNTGQNPLSHYAACGFQEKRSPHPLFDLDYYLANNPDLVSAGVEPLGHHLSEGWREARRVHPLFDADWYAARNMGGNPSSSPLAHYAEHGMNPIRAPHPLFDAAWYLDQNPDVSLLSRHPLVHYTNEGHAEDRSPHRLFDVIWYRNQSPELRANDRNPLTHFIETGYQSGCDPNPYFSCEWYLRTYPDVQSAGLNPLTHYVETGWHEGRDPSPEFSTSNYLAAYPEVATTNECPLIHYLETGRFEGKKGAPILAHPEPEAEYVPLSANPPLAERAARLLAFYLPQFHAIPENDLWWGKGFTEWTNVRQARPQYRGHYQPRLPDELGYYDLDAAPWMMRRQAELAQNYGLEGFCFYFYWFAGKRLLEKPIQTFAESADIDFPFCLCWANENWSRRWDGLDNEILIAQDHSPEDDIAFIAHLSQYLKNPRYIRIDDRPLLLVYRPSLLPDAAATAERWRTWCRDNDVGEIYLAYTQSFDKLHPEEIGFDAAVEFPPNNSGVSELLGQPIGLRDDFEGKLYDWKALADASRNYPPMPYKTFRGVNPSWDNTARRKSGGTILYGANPADYEAWLSRAIENMQDELDNPAERFVFINAWNEWAEGACLEPDAKYGYAWLERCYRALKNKNES